MNLKLPLFFQLFIFIRNINTRKTNSTAILLQRVMQLYIYGIFYDIVYLVLM